MIKKLARWLINYFNLNHYDTVEKVPDPSLIGSKWRLSNCSPWDNTVITIIDEKDGWVRYTYPTGIVKWDMPTRTMKSIYKRIN